MSDIVFDKYVILGYIFGFVGSMALMEKALVAFLLGFIGAFGGWLFEQFVKYLEIRKKNNKSKYNGKS